MDLIQEWKLKCTLSSSPLVSKCGPHQHHLGTDYKCKFWGPTPDLLNSSKKFWGTINFWNQFFSPVIFNPGYTLKSPRKLGEVPLSGSHPQGSSLIGLGCGLGSGNFWNSSHDCKEKPGLRTIAPAAYVIWAFMAK